MEVQAFAIHILPMGKLTESFVPEFDCGSH